MSATAAVALNLKGVGDPPEPVRSAQLILQGLELPGRDLYDPAALHAYQVVVMFVAEDMFVMGVFVVPLHLLNETAFHEKRDGPVD